MEGQRFDRGGSVVVADPRAGQLWIPPWRDRMIEGLVARFSRLYVIGGTLASAIGGMILFGPAIGSALGAGLVAGLVFAVLGGIGAALVEALIWALLRIRLGPGINYRLQDALLLRPQSGMVAGLTPRDEALVMTVFGSLCLGAGIIGVIVATWAASVFLGAGLSALLAAGMLYRYRVRVTEEGLLVRRGLRAEALFAWDDIEVLERPVRPVARLVSGELNTVLVVTSRTTGCRFQMATRHAGIAEIKRELLRRIPAAAYIHPFFEIARS